MWARRESNVRARDTWPSGNLKDHCVLNSNKCAGPKIHIQAGKQEQVFDLSHGSWLPVWFLSQFVEKGAHF